MKKLFVLLLCFVLFSCERKRNITVKEKPGEVVNLSHSIDEVIDFNAEINGNGMGSSYLLLKYKIRDGSIWLVVINVKRGIIYRTIKVKFKE